MVANKLLPYLTLPYLTNTISLFGYCRTCNELEITMHIATINVE